MKSLRARIFDRIEGLVDPFAPYPQTTPHKSPVRFVLSHLGPFRRVMIWANGMGTAVAVLELGLIWYAGRMVDLMTAGPATFWAQNGAEVALAAIILLLLRPVTLAVNAALLFAGVSTNMLVQVRWRAHQHMLGQPVGFFQNDFAGRLANRVMTTGVAVEDSSFLLFEAFWQAAAFAIAVLVLLAGMDLWLALPFALWIGAFVGFALWFAPHAGRAAEKNSYANSRVTGRIVDSYSNIETVKPFAHAEREQRFARSALKRQRLRFGALMRVFAVQQGAMAAFNSATIAMALRLNTMTVWIMWMIVRGFEHLGTIREGLQSVAVPQSVTDRPAAPALAVQGDAISFNALTHHYGKGFGGLNGISLTVAAAIQSTLYGMMEGKTVIAIAHRLSTIGKMDRIIVMEHGRIIEDGTHADLLAVNGTYARFWARQSGGFIGSDTVPEPRFEAAE